jgi:signal transduction histidine kinase
MPDSRFPLMRYFAVVSLVVIAMLIGGAELITMREVREQLIERGESYAIRIAQHLNQDLHHRFGSPLDLRELMTHREKAAELQEDLRGLGVERVKLYDDRGVIVYSDVVALIGTDDWDNPGVQGALAGQVSSELVQARETVDVPGEPELVVDVLETYVPLYDLTNPDQIIGVIEVYQDVSDIRRQLYQLQGRVTVTSLAMMVLLFLSLLGLTYRADRVIARQFADLREASVRLMALQQTKDDLTHMIVHDLKNPLSSIQLNLQMLLQTVQEPLSERQVQCVERALQSCEHGMAIIGDLLDVTRLEEGRLPLQIEPLDLAEVIVEATNSLVDVARAKGKVLSLSLPGTLPRVLADRGLLRRVFDNLLSNALKYARTRIEVRVEGYSETGYLQVSICDDGPGIPSQFREAIFDRFVQVQPADARKGTGLGLTFCKLVVEALGGRIWVEDGKGDGCRFVFLLPVQEGHRLEGPVEEV